MDRQLLNRATEGTEAPTPGYMYIDIAKNASASPMACQEIATFLTRKLANKQNANIKFKCLKILSKTSDAVPRGQFKRTVAQDQSAVAAIRLATNFRGPPDPVRGDEPYNRVRLAAKEALDAIYSDTPASQEPSPYNSGGGGVSNTYGAPPHQQSSPHYGGGGGGMPPGGGGGRRMEGIGNPMFSDPRLEPQPSGTVGAIMKDVGESFVGMIKDPLARHSDQPRANHGDMPRPGGMQGYGNNHSSGTYGRPPPGQAQLAHDTQNQWTMASNRGPNAVPPAGHGGDSYYKSRDNSDSAFSWANKGGGQPGGFNSWGASGGGPTAAGGPPSYHEQHSATPSITVNSAPTSHSSPSTNPQHGGAAVQDGSYERNLVMELCPAGGMKPVPPPEKLLNFAKSVPSLNSDLICPVLLDCLEEGNPWIMRAKALCVMETCIQAGQRDDNSNPYAQFFFTCREEIDPLTVHARSAIKDPARRVCVLLGIEASSLPKAPAPVAAAAPPAPVTNLLDFDNIAPPAPVANSVPTSAPPPPPQTAPPPPPVPVATGAGGAGSSSMFGGMQVKGSTPQKTAPAVPPDVSTATSGELLDGLMSPTTTMSQAPPAMGTMFDQLTVKDSKDEEPKKAAAASGLADVAASGSAFGFINDEKKDGDAVAAPLPKESFDPLLNFSPNTAKQMMQVSQEQMQAMAYQQMLMQQQFQQKQYQQMQQMQMAMAMQAGAMPRAMGPGGVPAVPMGMMPATQNGVMGPHAGNTSSSFSFLDAPAQKKDDHTFDFVMDAMKTEKTHK